MQNAVNWWFMLKVTYGCALVAMHLASSPSFLSVCISWQSAFMNSHFEDWSLNSKVAEQWREDDLCCSGSSRSHSTQCPWNSHK